MTGDRAGYAHARYAASLAAFGTPRHLPGSDAWLLERSIPGTDARDAMGCYPLLCCERWDALDADLTAHAGDLVTVTGVTDPFGADDEALLRRTFGHVRRFKEHHVADLSLGVDAAVSSHHRYYARRALAAQSVTEHPQPTAFLDQWVTLYASLVRRHALRGIQAFGREAFAIQLAVPGVRLFVAEQDGVVTGAQIWYVAGDVAYNHLQAASDAGYQLGAAYALYITAMRALAREVRWLHLGAGAGASPSTADGLARFKAGWATGTRPAYLCGRVVNPRRYADLCRQIALRSSAASTDAHDDYFPAYRAGDMG